MSDCRRSSESVRCDLCGAGDAEPALTLHDLMFRATAEPFQLVRCRGCGLLFLNPQPGADVIDRSYPPDYTPHGQRGLSARVKAWGFRRDVAELWDLLAPPRKIIDVGCGTGELAQAVRRRGNPNVLGIEPSPAAAERARRRWGIEVVEGTLSDAGLPCGSVDAALLSHVIEHLPSPSATVEELRRVLRPGGALILWLPNAGSWAAALFRGCWIGYDAPRHLTSFTVETLTDLLGRHGFEVVSVKHEWIGLEWSWGPRLVARQYVDSPALDRWLGRLHPLTTAALSPVSWLAARRGQAGRIRVVARLRAPQAPRAG